MFFYRNSFDQETLTEKGCLVKKPLQKRLYRSNSPIRLGTALRKKMQVPAVCVSARVFTFAALLLSLISLSVCADRFVSVRAQTPNSPVFDDFQGSTIDTSKWVVQQNVNGGNGGTVTVADSYVSLTSDGTSFPIIYSATNPFPESGDFAVEVDIQYTRLTGWGTGFWVTQGPFVPAEYELNANILQVWAHIDETGPNVLVLLLGKQVHTEAIQKNPFRAFNSSTLTFRLQCSGNIYTLYLNGEAIVSVNSTLRADTIGFGHPPLFCVPFPYPSQWTSFRISCIRIPQASALSISTSPSSATEVNHKVSISGRLTESQGAGLPGASVLLLYQIPGMSTWNPVTSAITDANGAYAATWFVPATGNFLLKAEWRGDETHCGTHKTTNVSVTLGEGEPLFLAESNSTLSSLAFSSASKEISFTASGPSGTAGYVRFVVSKTLMENLTDFKVYLDGQPVQFTITSEAQTQVLFFQYSHSSHNILIKMLSSAGSFLPDLGELPVSNALPLLLGGVAIVIVTALIGVAIRRRRGNVGKIIPE